MLNCPSEKPDYKQEKPHKIFENKLEQNFTAKKPNPKWCTDFTYLFLKNHEIRYNCSIIDLFNESVVASITDRHMTSALATRTLQKALDAQAGMQRKTDFAKRPGHTVHLKSIH